MKNDVVFRIFEIFKAQRTPVYLLEEPVHDWYNGAQKERYARLRFVTQRLEPWMGRELAREFPGAEPSQDARRVRFKAGECEVQVAAMRRSLPPYFPMETARLEPLTLDLASREVTVNAVALDADWNVIDPFRGIEDRRRRVCRTVAAPEAILPHSALWILKAAVHAAEQDLAVDPGLTRVARQWYYNVVGFRPEIMREHLERVLVASRGPAPLELLAESGVLGVLLPEVEALRGFDRSSPLHHKDLWDHTVRVVLQIEPAAHLRWVALLHDVGKVHTRRTESGRVSFLRHEEIGAFLFKGIAARLEFPDAERERIEYLIAHHSRINHYGEAWTDTAIRRLMRDAGEHLRDLVAFSRADITSRVPERVAALRRLLIELEVRMDDVARKDSEPPLLPAGLGNRLMEVFDLQPGPLVGRIRSWLGAEVEAGRLDRNAGPDYYIEHLKNHPDVCRDLGVTA
jgi:poly(A) polymerase